MIRVSCQNLQQVKNDPALYAANLVSKTKSGRRRGMFSQWQTVARELHIEKIPLTEGVKRLSSLYSIWVDNERNRNRESFFQESLIRYHNIFIKKGFVFQDGNHVMKWQLHKNVMLGGYTPCVAVKYNRYYAYAFTEHYFDWSSELRFPLLQHYLSTQTLHCGLSDLQIGIYSLADHRFDFRTFSAREIVSVKKETIEIFEALSREYLKRSAI